MSAAVTAYIGLGSNLDGPRERVEAALERLDAEPRCRVTAASRLYRNPALTGPGVPAQPDYVNAVARLATGLEPLALLEALQGIEAEQQRRREAAVRWGPRTLDLDLLLYAERTLHSERLLLPHPELHRRAFALWPLAEIDPGAVVPGRGRVGELAAAVDASALEALERRCKVSPTDGVEVSPS